VKEVFTGIGNGCLNSCYLNSCLLSIVRAFVSTRKCFLSLPQLISKALEVLGVSNLLTITGSNQGGDSRVNSYSFINRRQRFNCVVFNQQGDKPATRCIQPHGDGGWFAACGDSATPTDGQRFRTLRQPQLSVLPLESRTGKLSADTVGECNTKE